MNLIVCVDDKFGISFMGRRLSRDRLVSEDIIRTVGENKLYIHPDSAVLFSDHSDKVIADTDFLNMAEAGDYCFFEKGDPDKYKDGLESLILYKWNRRYPADSFFDLTVIGEKLPDKVYNFKGNSHDNITKEVYIL